jgi:hypothetical protein
MRYLAQPCDERSDPRHTAGFTGLLRRQTRGRTPALANAHSSVVVGFCGLSSGNYDKSPTHSSTLSRIPVASRPDRKLPTTNEEGPRQSLPLGVIDHRCLIPAPLLDLRSCLRPLSRSLAAPRSRPFASLEMDSGAALRASRISAFLSIKYWSTGAIVEYLSDCAAAFGTRKPMPIANTKMFVAMIRIIFFSRLPSSRGILPPPLLALLYDFG